MTRGPHTRPTLLADLKDYQDFKAWDLFVGIYKPLIVGIARRRGLQNADAEDVAQDVLLAVASAIRHFEYDPSGSFRAYLFEATRKKLFTFLGKQRRQPHGTGDTDFMQQLAQQLGQEDVGLAQIEWDEVVGLDKHEWDAAYRKRLLEWAFEQVARSGQSEDSTLKAARLTILEGKTNAEAAAFVNLTPNAVAIAKSRVLQKMEETLREIAGT